MGARSTGQAYEAKRVDIAEVTAGGWSAVTHMTTSDMCAFARDLVDAARRPGAAAAVRVNDFGIGIVCLGWTKESVRAHEHCGLALFQDVTAHLFRAHFEIVHTPQLRGLQGAAWRVLDSRTKRDFIMAAIAGAESRVRGAYTETHPGFVKFVERQRRLCRGVGGRRPASGGGGGEGSEGSGSGV